MSWGRVRRATHAFICHAGIAMAASGWQYNLRYFNATARSCARGGVAGIHPMSLKNMNKSAGILIVFISL
ncbi:hypothetical protein CFR71_12025 [Novacetimonas pomaceti]|uniref:Uncharacterized protein n=1 Tax=Novacetimonas pomaceti TaxID=2021998 RepID=A0A318QBS3_9PROT|nr:hypothetical protein CFR71_12025 [Novacetimonas pomaceti]